MKSFLIVAISALTLFACQTTKPIVDGDDVHGSNLVSGKVSRMLFSQDKADSSESSIQFMFYEPIHRPYQDTVNRIVKEYISGTVSYGGGATEQNSALSIGYMNECIDKFADEYNRQSEFVDGGGVWTTETNVEILERESDYVELSIANWDYSGGAHGNSWSIQHIIDMKTGRELLLKDFIIDVAQLTQIAEKIFRADQELAPDADLSDAGFWFEDGVFALNENFTFNPESLDFMYNSYEIAAYAAGPIYISIPMSDIKHLLKRKVY